MHDGREDAGTRTLYVFDVRQLEEYIAGHLPDSVSAPGCQLVQELDRYVAVCNARIVLVNDTEVRALMVGSWLRQRGWRDVAVLAGGTENARLVRGTRHSPVLGLDRARPPAIDVTALDHHLASGTAVVLHFANVRRFRAGHIPDAYYAIRTQAYPLMSSLSWAAPRVYRRKAQSVVHERSRRQAAAII